MIGKCKAITHGSTALDYIFREGNLGNILFPIKSLRKYPEGDLRRNEDGQ